MSDARMGAKEFTRIAAATSLAVDTVRRYYAGKNVTEANRQLIEKAAFELDLPAGRAARVVSRS